jgi:hypothetical protein
MYSFLLQGRRYTSNELPASHYFCPEDGISTFIQSVDELLKDYTASNSTRQFYPLPNSFSGSFMHLSQIELNVVDSY